MFLLPAYKLTPSYGNESYEILSTSNDWELVLDKKEYPVIDVDMAYEQATYFVYLMSKKQPIVKEYQFKVKTTVTEVPDKVVDIYVSKNNQMSFGTEVYTPYQLGSNGEGEIEAYYDGYNSFTISGYGIWAHFKSSSSNQTYVSYFDDWLWDENTQESKNVLIKLNIHIDNQTPVNESLMKEFAFTVDYNDLQMASNTDTPVKVSLKYNDRRDEEFILGYDVNGSYTDGYGNYYKNQFVKLHESNDEQGNPFYEYYSVLGQTSPNQVIGSSYYGNPVVFTITNMPEVPVENHSLAITKENSNEHPVELDLGKHNIIGYLKHGMYYVHGYEKEGEYDGVHYLDVPSSSFDAEKGGNANSKIYLRRSDSNRIVKIYNLSLIMEPVIHETKEAISLEINQQSDYYHKQYVESADGLVVLGGSYYQYDEGYGEYTAIAFPTETALELGKVDIEGYVIIFDSEETSSSGQFVYLDCNEKGIFKKYPLVVTADTTPFNGELEKINLKTEVTAAEAIKVSDDPNANYFNPYGKKVTLSYSPYESISGNIYLDRENQFKLHKKETPKEERYIFLNNYYFKEFVKKDKNLYECAYSEGVNISLTVTDDKIKEVLPKSISLSPITLELGAAESKQLKATITPEDAANQSVKWTSSDEKIAFVDGNGNVYGVEKGSATITAETVNGKKATTKITVTADAPSVTVNDQSSGISVTAPSTVFPKGAELQVTPVSSGKDYDSLGKLTEDRFVLYDIKLINKQEDAIVQPNGNVKVSMPIPADYDSSKVKLYYYDEKTGKRTKIEGVVENGFFVFEVDHFSYYALVEEKTEENGEKVDKSKLQKLYDKVEKYAEADYETAGWQNFALKREEAKGILANLNATQEQVDKIYTELNDVTKLLKKKSGTAGSDAEDKPDTSSEGEDKNNNGTSDKTSSKDKSEGDKPSNNNQGNNQSNKAKDDKKQGLFPQTNEAATAYLTILGMLFVLVSQLFWKELKKFN